MAERSGFFNSQQTGGSYDRTYNAEDFSNVFRQFLGNGIMVTDDEAENNTVFDKTTCDGLKPSIYGTSNVQIAPGFAFINGYWYHNDSIASKAIQSSWESRLLVLQFATATRQITLEFIPYSDSLTQTEDIYQIPIALVQRSGSVFTVTDTREDFITASLKVIQNATRDIMNQEIITAYGAEINANARVYNEAPQRIILPTPIVLEKGTYLLMVKFRLDNKAVQYKNDVRAYFRYGFRPEVGSPLFTINGKDMDFPYYSMAQAVNYVNDMVIFKVDEGEEVYNIEVYLYSQPYAGGDVKFYEHQTSFTSVSFVVQKIY